MRKLLVLAVLAFAAAVDAQVVTEMTPERIREAIADTKSDGCYDLKKGFACFTTPYSRVAQAAQAAKKKYEPFTEASVTPEMVAPIVEVLAWPQPSFIYGRGRTGPPIDVTTVVVMPAKSKDLTAAIQPTERVDLDQHYQNLLGARYEANGIVAKFPLSVLTPENEVRIVYAGKGCQPTIMSKLSDQCTFRFDVKGVR